MALRTRVGALVVLVLGLAAALVVALSSPATAGTDHHWQPLRVASYNIHHGAGTDGALDLERIARVIGAMRADVVGLQEVDRHWSERSDFVDQAAWLSRRLGMRVVYGANLDLDPLQPGQPRRQYGTAILSRYPILSWRNTYLPRFGDHEQRGLLEAVVTVRGTRVRVADTHLQHNDNLEREAQAARIVELLGPDPRRTVLLGDLNAVPGTPEIETLTGVFVDSWAAVGDGAGFTYPAELPDRRIDYVLASPDVRPVAARVPATDASDHLPVVVDYLVPRGR
jgi:endonuclease/exonuclease/phosphatase family metal-dependent hydrolase